MEKETYEVEAQVERDHWWFKGRRKILARLLEALSPTLPPGARALDVGCGTGANGPVLAERGLFAVGLDASPVPLGLAGTGERGHAARLRGDAAHLPFADASLDLVVALDVLEHLPDDRAATREIFRVLRPGGALIAFVPALRLLWGFQDEVAHHLRRYGKKDFAGVIAQAGLRIDRVTFFNSLLFAPILAARLAMRVRPPRHLMSENQIGGPVTNTLLGGIFALEAPLLARLDLPVGVSLACVAHKP
jgi:SAM-dependent methyltransferase